MSQPFKCKPLQLHLVQQLWSVIKPLLKSWPAAGRKHAESGTSAALRPMPAMSTRGCQSSRQQPKQHFSADFCCALCCAVLRRQQQIITSWHRSTGLQILLICSAAPAAGVLGKPTQAMATRLHPCPMLPSGVSCRCLAHTSTRCRQVPTGARQGHYADEILGGSHKIPAALRSVAAAKFANTFWADAATKASKINRSWERLTSGTSRMDRNPWHSHVTELLLRCPGALLHLIPVHPIHHMLLPQHTQQKGGLKVPARHFCLSAGVRCWRLKLIGSCTRSPCRP